MYYFIIVLSVILLITLYFFVPFIIEIKSENKSQKSFKEENKILEDLIDKEK